MTIQFTDNVFIAGSLVATGTQQTLAADDEAEYVNRGVAVYVGSNPAQDGLVPAMIKDGVLWGPDGPISLSMGAIALYGADYWDGSALTGSCDVPSATLAASPLGTKIAWSGYGSSGRPGVLFDTTAEGSGAFDEANPTVITIPAGVSYANFSFSVLFPYGDSDGIRVVRLVKGGTSHMSNVGAPAMPAASAFGQAIASTTGWINVAPGEQFSLHACQDSGTLMTISPGNEANKGGSTFLRADFR